MLHPPHQAPHTEALVQALHEAGLGPMPTPTHRPMPPTPKAMPYPMGVRLVIDIEGHYRIVGKERSLGLKAIGPHKAQDAL